MLIMIMKMAMTMMPKITARITTTMANRFLPTTFTHECITTTSTGRTTLSKSNITSHSQMQDS